MDIKKLKNNLKSKKKIYQDQLFLGQFYFLFNQTI